MCGLPTLVVIFHVSTPCTAPDRRWFLQPSHRFKQCLVVILVKAWVVVCDDKDADSSDPLPQDRAYDDLACIINRPAEISHGSWGKLLKSADLESSCTIPNKSH